MEYYKILFQEHCDVINCWVSVISIDKRKLLVFTENELDNKEQFDEDNYIQGNVTSPFDFFYVAGNIINELRISELDIVGLGTGSLIKRIIGLVKVRVIEISETVIKAYNSCIKERSLIAQPAEIICDSGDNYLESSESNDTIFLDCYTSSGGLQINDKNWNKCLSMYKNIFINVIDGTGDLERIKKAICKSGKSAVSVRLSKRKSNITKCPYNILLFISDSETIETIKEDFKSEFKIKDLS